MKILSCIEVAPHKFNFKLRIKSDEFPVQAFTKFIGDRHFLTAATIMNDLLVDRNDLEDDLIKLLEDHVNNMVVYKAA